MFLPRSLSSRLSLLALTALAACATPVKQVPPTPPPAVVPTVMPTPPRNSAPDMVPPDKDEAGKFITPNRDSQGDQALWHVRMGLNVAALGCPETNGQTRILYNQMLTVHGASLKRANDTLEVSYQQRYGSSAIRMREVLNTLVYNFFALPPAQKAFCQKAVATMTIINGLTPEALAAYAPKALDELEQPFRDFWAEYEDYLRRLEEWRKRFGATVRLVGPVGGDDLNDHEPPAPTAPAPMGQVPATPMQRPSDMILPDAPASAPAPAAPAPSVPAPAVPGTPSAPPPVVPTQPQVQAPKLPLQPVPAPPES